MLHLVAALLHLVAAQAPPVSAFKTALQAIADAKSEQYGCGFAIGVRAPTFAVSVAAGDAAWEGAKVTPESSFAWGSVTKLTTGVGILRLADGGAFGLDDFVAPLVDPFIKSSAAGRFNFSSLVDLFGTEAANITIRQLATMQSGVPDYDTAKPDEHNRSKSVDPFRATCYSQPTKDYAPLELLAVPWVHKGALDFSPGTDMDYSSTNFILLGLLLAAHSGSASWEAFDQGSFRPAALVREGFMARSQYAVTGAPSRFTPVRGYDRTSYNGHTGDAVPGTDVGDVHGVFAGWSASDLVAPVQDVADLCHAIYAVSPATDASQLVTGGDVRMMTNSSHFYGFATFLLPGYSGQPTDGPQYGAPDYGTIYGHLGATYGCARAAPHALPPRPPRNAAAHAGSGGRQVQLDRRVQRGAQHVGRRGHQRGVRLPGAAERRLLPRVQQGEAAAARRARRGRRLHVQAQRLLRQVRVQDHEVRVHQLGPRQALRAPLQWHAELRGVQLGLQVMPCLHEPCRAQQLLCCSSAPRD